MSMLVLAGVTKRFHPGGADEVLALNGIDLQLQRGERVTIIGTNGSGKSTLLGAIAGSVECDAGRIMLDGHELAALPEHRRARWIGRVFQDPFRGTAPSMSVAENLALAAGRGHGSSQRRSPLWSLGWALDGALRREISERVAGLGMGLENRLDAAMGTLSGGQRQALTLLMATWHTPALLLLDEHTAALDPRSAGQVMALTRKRIERDAITTIQVTHSMQQAAESPGRILLMHRGAIAREWPQGAGVPELLAAFEDLRARDELVTETGPAIR